MAQLDGILSEENLRSYGDTCVELALDLATTRNFDTLMIPSRGAVPIFLGVLTALDRLQGVDKAYSEFFSRIKIPKMIKENLHPGFVLPNGDGKDPINLLLCPFTADLNVEKHLPNVDNDVFVNRTRAYWAEVASSFYLDRQDRTRNPHFQLYLQLLRSIEGRTQLGESYLEFPKVNKMCMVDTVVSGRAAYTILDAFDKIGKRKGEKLTPYAFLVVDSNGAKLRYPYTASLTDRANFGEAKLYKMPRIVSEDEGAAFEGVASLVYPTLMLESLGLKTNGDELFFGAGSWHPVTGLGDYNKAFSLFANVVEEAVRLESAKLLGDGSTSTGELERNLAGLVEYFSKNPHLRRCETSLGPLKLAQGAPNIGRVYETSSRVMHVAFSPEDSKRFMTDFVNQNSELNLKYNSRKIAEKY